jgi:hypothetical protein
VLPTASWLLALVDQHQANTGQTAATVVADHKYGTTENYVACQQRGLRTHLGDARAKQNHVRRQGIFPDTAFRRAAGALVQSGPDLGNTPPRCDLSGLVCSQLGVLWSRKLFPCPEHHDGVNTLVVEF